MIKHFFILLLLFIIPSFSMASDCSEYNKLSKNYISCKAKIFKAKSTNVKNETNLKFNKNKNKIKNFDIKGKLLKFKNSKSLKEFIG